MLPASRTIASSRPSARHRPTRSPSQMAEWVRSQGDGHLVTRMSHWIRRHCSTPPSDPRGVAAVSVHLLLEAALGRSAEFHLAGSKSERWGKPGGRPSQLGLATVPPLPLHSARSATCLHRAAVPPLEPARGPPPPVERPGPVGPAAARPPSEQGAGRHRRRALLTEGLTVRRMARVPRSAAPAKKLLAPGRPAARTSTSPSRFCTWPLMPCAMAMR